MLLVSQPAHEEGGHQEQERCNKEKEEEEENHRRAGGGEGATGLVHLEGRVAELEIGEEQSGEDETGAHPPRSSLSTLTLSASPPPHCPPTKQTDSFWSVLFWKSPADPASLFFFFLPLWRVVERCLKVGEMVRGGASAPKKHCTNPGCAKPDESTMFVQVDGSSSSGGKDWSSLAGSTLCQACFTFFKRNGTLKCEEAPASPLDGSARRGGKEAAQALSEGRPGSQACGVSGAQSRAEDQPGRGVEKQVEEDVEDDAGQDKKTARRLNVDEDIEGGEQAEGDSAKRPGGGNVAAASNTDGGKRESTDGVMHGVELLLQTEAGRKAGESVAIPAMPKFSVRGGMFTPPPRHANGVRACVHRQAPVEDGEASVGSSTTSPGVLGHLQIQSPEGVAGAAMTADEVDAVALLESMRHVSKDSEKKRRKVDKMSTSQGPGSMQGKDFRTLVQMHDEKKSSGKLKGKERKQREPKAQGRKGALTSPGGAGGGSPDGSRGSDADGDTTPKSHGASEPKDSQRKRARSSEESFRKNAKYRLADQNGNVIRENLPQVPPLSLTPPKSP